MGARSLLWTVTFSVSHMREYLAFPCHKTSQDKVLGAYMNALVCSQMQPLAGCMHSGCPSAISPHLPATFAQTTHNQVAHLNGSVQLVNVKSKGFRPKVSP